jgi:sulfate adenylyltransferase subunit 2
MLHVALNSFPLLHVDTTWKFRDMIAFRDQRAKATPAEVI